MPYIWKWIHEKKDQNENPRTTWKGQMPLPNIHLINNSKYPQSGKEIKTFSTISDISHSS